MAIFKCQAFNKTQIYMLNWKIIEYYNNKKYIKLKYLMGKC